MASILETFYILFETNSAQVKKGAGEAGTATKDLEQNLGAADAAATAVSENLIARFGQVGAAIAAAFSLEKLAAFVSATTEYNAQLSINSQRLGVSVEDLDAWSKATEHAGGSAEGFIGTLDFLNRGLAGLNTPGGTSRLKPFLEELKINPHSITSSLQLLQVLSDKSKELGAVKFAGIAERFGLDPGTQLLIAKGKLALDERIKQEKELGVATQADADKAMAYKQELDNLTHQMDRLATGIASAVIPGLISFFQWVGKAVDYLGQHRGLVEGFFIGVAGVIATVYLPAATEAAIATWAFLAPILAIVLPILAIGAAFALVMDDVQNFLKGNKSVIGELSKSWPEVGETVRSVSAGAGKAWNGFVDTLRTSKDLIVSILGLVNAAYNKSTSTQQQDLGKMIAANDAAWPKMAAGVKSFKGDLDALGRALKELITGPIGWFLETLGLVPKAFEHWATDLNGLTADLNNTGKRTYGQRQDDERDRLNRKFYPGVHGDRSPAVLRPAQGAPNLTDAWAPQVAGAVTKGVVDAQVSLNLADLTPLSSKAGSFLNSTQGGDRSLTINAPVTINGVDGDPNDFAAAFGKHLDDQIRQAVDHFDNGVGK